jgi:Xaa-Pro aminopeptidase
MNRREALVASGGGLAAAFVKPAGDAEAAVTPTADSPIVLPDFSFLRDEPLVGAERLRDFMGRAGLDALVVTRPANVFYLTNHYPQLDRMGLEKTAFAIFPKDPAREIALVMHAFSYYYTHSDEVRFGGRLVFPYTQPSASGGLDEWGEPKADAPQLLRIVDDAWVSAREKSRRAAFSRARPNSAGPDWALAKAIRALRLEGTRLGTDDGLIEPLLRARGIDATFLSGENTLRRARMVKTPPEIQLMRHASAANVHAALAAARNARKTGTARKLRADFFAEAERRGNHGVFVVVDQTSTEVLDSPLVEGMAFSIDCVSHCRYYHGDFARTIFIGEPRAAMKRAAEGIHGAWREIRSRLRAGMAFSEIPKIGKETLRKTGHDLTVNFTPHSVGLFHTDHPLPRPNDPLPLGPLALEEGMILSVDCPILDAGIGGSAHLEDLMLIGRDGAEPIHEVPPNVVMVA